MIYKMLEEISEAAVNYTNSSLTQETKELSSEDREGS